jgi:pyruvate,water dikinase
MTHTNPTPSPGQPIPPPPDFPLHWPNPAQARKLWVLDRAHFPEPVPPLIGSLSEAVIAAPFNQAAEQYALPIRLATLYLNTYLYFGFAPVGAPPDFVLKALNSLSRVAPGAVNSLMDRAVAGMTDKYMARLEPVIERLGDYWAGEWLPEIKTHLAYWEGFDLAAATLSQLLAHLEESIRRIIRAWEIHHSLTLPAFLALGQFHDLYHELFGDDDPFGAFHLLQGFDNKFLEADRALWQLSRQALTLPKVYQVLAENPPATVLPALASSPEGHVFLAEWQAYLAAYGQRGRDVDGLTGITWLEDPAPALKNLQDYLTQPDRDLEAELKLQAAEREQGLAQVRERLHNYPRPVIDRFERLLQAAQCAAVLHEEHNFWIDQRCQYQVRQVILAVGERLALAGMLDRANDIFYLTLEEIRETPQKLAVLGARPALSGWPDAVAARRAEEAHFRAINPPSLIGTMPWMEPPNDPFSRSFGKVIGGPPVQTGSAGTVLQGQAASPGLARGRARVIRTLAEAGRLQPGEILVAQATMPPWTPLFATAAAVVTDTGGILSHCAVVAREYHIPAVVGAGMATTIIQDGQLVEVNGNAGLVRLVTGEDGVTAPPA